MSSVTTIDVGAVVVTMTKQVRSEGWKNHHSIYLLSLHPIDRDALVNALPLDVLVSMTGGTK